MPGFQRPPTFPAQAPTPGSGGGGGAPTGPAGGDLDGTYPNPDVIALHESGSGGTRLTLGSIADGEFLKRVGTTIVGAASTTGDVAAIIATYDCPAGVGVQDCVYKTGVANEVDTCDPNDVTKMPARGMVISKPSATTCRVLHIGRSGAVLAGLTIGAEHYVGAGGALSPTQPVGTPRVVQPMGVGLDTGEILLKMGPPNTFT